jgi:hypothetical protein
MKLTVRERFDEEMNDDMVRIDDTHRGGIRSGSVCRLTGSPPFITRAMARPDVTWK